MTLFNLKNLRDRLIQIKALVLHNIYYSTKNNIYRLAEAILWPLWELSIWGFFSLQFKSMSPSPFLSSSQFFIGSLFLWSFVRRLQEDISSSLLVNINSRNFKNILITPISLFDLILSMIISSLIKYFFSFVVIFFVSLFLFQFNVLFFVLKVFIFFILLLIFGWVLGFLSVGLIFRTGGRIMFVSSLVSLIIQPFSCVFYSRSVLPGFLKTISYLLPTSYVFENLRQLVSYQKFDYRDLGIILLLDLIYLCLSLIFIKMMYYSGRKKGKLMEI